MPKIIFKDDSIFVIDKPAFMPAVSLNEGEKNTLASWILAKFPDQAKMGLLDAGLVHRLDNGTSGVIVAARSTDAYKNLRAQFDSNVVQKKYTALIVGDPPAEGVIDTPIAHHPRKKNKMVACNNKKQINEWSARAARTLYRVKERYFFLEGGIKKTRYALLEVAIETGVRHQVRVHLASIGFPVAGDTLYQNPKIRSQDLLKMERYFLHASEISFAHPASHEQIGFSSPMPKNLTDYILKLFSW